MTECFSFKLLFIIIFSFLFIYSSITVTYAGQNKGEIISITPDGFVYINLGFNDGISEGDLIEIYEGGEKILTLQVEDAYQKVSKLHPPKRKDLPKLRVGLEVRPYLVEVSISAIEGKLISFDSVQESGFIDLGTVSGVEEGMEFEVLKGADVVATLKVTRAFSKISKVELIEKPKVKDLTGFKVRGKVVKKEVPIGGFRKLVQIIKERFSGEFRSIFTNYDIDGNKSQSFYPSADASFREELDLKYMHTPTKGPYTEAYASGRWTDDSYVDTEDLSMENCYFSLSGKNLKSRFGDFLGNFNNYALSTSLKGLKVDLTKDDAFGTLNFHGVCGSTKTKWEDFWEEIDNETYSRYVAGFRISQDFWKKHILGISYVNTDDDKQSTAPPGTIPQENRVINIDLESKPFKFLKIDSEWAMSYTKRDDNAPDEPYKNGTALKIDTDLAISGWNFKNKYERVSANFQALSGVASADRDEYYSQIKYKLLDRFSSKAGYRYYHDNTRKLLTLTTHTHIYDYSISMNPFDKLPDLELGHEFDTRKRSSSDTSVDDKTTTYTFSVFNKTGIFRYGTDYSLVEKLDDTDLDNNRRKHIWNFDIKANFKSGNLRLMPLFSYEIEKDKQKTSKDIDTYQKLRTGISLYIGSISTLSIYWTHSDTDYFLEGRDQVNDYVNFKSRLYLSKDRDRMVEISFKQNDYNRANDDISFTENIFNLQYTHRF